MNTNYPQRLTIRAWAEEDKPREKLILKGRQALTDAELLAIILGSGNSHQTAVELAQTILNAHQNSYQSLARHSVKDLCKFKGVGHAKAVSIVAALEIGRRRQSEQAESKPQINSSKVAYNLLFPYLQDKVTEEFWIIFLNQNNRVIRVHQLSQGGIAGTVVDTRMVFKEALDCLATGMILSHNHPSGNLSPSQQDIKLTERLADAGKILQISVTDHLIIGNGAYFSFADEGLI